jgi:hypothetical protein
MFQVSGFKFQVLSFRFYILCIFVLFFLWFSVANAQSLRLSSGNSLYEVGETFLVSLSLNTQGKSINTISGSIRIPSSARLSDVRFGNSIVTLWVEKPAYNASREVISFVGGTPGGYSGSNGPILSFVLAGKSVGDVSVTLQDVSLLLNDGLGTEVPNPGLSHLAVSITKAAARPAPQPGETPAKEEEPVQSDTTPPEPFTISIASDPSIEDGDFFASFNAVDKDTGVLRYVAKERPWLFSFLGREGVEAQSPYILKHQWWPTEVVIQAFDQAGNVRESKAMTPFQSSFALVLILVAIALSGGIMYWYARQKRRS